MTAPTRPAPRRHITADQYRSARRWVEGRRALLADWSCAERVLAVVAALISAPGHDPIVNGAELAKALREVETIDAALDLLATAGCGCT